MAKPFPASPATVAVQIEVVGADLDGQQYMERTQTLTITRDGATIQLANKLAPESELIIRNVLTNEEALARVVGHVREDASGHVYGIALLDPTVDLWRVPLPHHPIGGLHASLESFSARVEPARGESEKRTVLECSRCHAVKSVPLTEIETMILESKQALTRHCECSNSSTIWKVTAREVSVEPKRIAFRERSGAEPALSLAQQKRNDRRIPMKSVACIRYGGQEEVAVCEDMSRGGFRFKGRKKYARGTRIEAAVPYLHANVNIFVPAQIVYHQELSATSHRHGVCYLRMPGNSDKHR